LIHPDKKVVPSTSFCLLDLWSGLLALACRLGVDNPACMLLMLGCRMAEQWEKIYLWIIKRRLLLRDLS